MFVNYFFDEELSVFDTTLIGRLNVSSKIVRFPAKGSLFAYNLINASDMWLSTLKMCWHGFLSSRTCSDVILSNSCCGFWLHRNPSRQAPWGRGASLCRIYGYVPPTRVDFSLSKIQSKPRLLKFYTRTGPDV